MNDQQISLRDLHENYLKPKRNRHGLFFLGENERLAYQFARFIHRLLKTKSDRPCLSKNIVYFRGKDNEGTRRRREGGSERDRERESEREGGTDLYLRWPWDWTSAWYLVLQVSRG